MALNRAKLLESADKLVRQGKINEAIKHYLALSEDNPRDVNTINRIGDLYVRLRKNKEAIRQFVRIADFYAGDGFHLKAIAMYKKITKLDPSHVEANERLADLYAKQGLTIEARTQYLSLAEQCLKAGQKPKAIEIYQKVQAMEPDNPKIKVVLADLLGKEGDPGKAVDSFLSAAADLKARGMTEEALKVLIKAYRLAPSRGEIQAELAAVLKGSKKKPQEITSTLEQLHQAIPGSESLLELLGGNYLAVGRSADFEKLRQAQKTGTGRACLTRCEARHLHSRGESDKAVARLKSAAEDALRDSGPEESAALLELALEIRPEDVECLEKLLDIWTTASHKEGMVSAAERLVRLLCEKADWERAAGFLDRLRETAPEHPALDELRPLIDAGRGIGAGGDAREAATSEVPSLDELEKVVELDSGSGDSDWEGPAETAGEETLSAAPEETPAEEPETDVWAGEGKDVSEVDEPEISVSEEEAAPEGEKPELREEGEGGEALPETELDAGAADGDDSLEADGGEAQDSAYAGKSKIQEMREEPEADAVDEEFLAEHFTEAEVFLKYGLAEKAREQLQTILARYPDHLPSLKKMKEICGEEGKKDEAAAFLRKAAEIHRSRGEEDQAREMDQQIRELAPPPASGKSPRGKRGPDALETGPVPREAAAAAAEEPDLDLDLPDLTVREEKAPPPTASPAPAAKPKSPPAAEEGATDEFVIDLAEDGLEKAAEATSLEAFDPEKAGQFDFYLEQRLLEEAEELLRQMESAAPGHPGVVERRARLSGLQPPRVQPSPGDSTGDLDMDVERAFGRGPIEPDPPPAEESPDADEGFFDLAAELKAHSAEAPADSEQRELPAGIASGEEASIDEIFKAFRKKVDQQVEEEDYETRYNLGIAYKEMGLLDEAIGEFQYASREPKLFLECCSILGICFREKGMTDLAIKWYRKALESTGHSEDKYQGLRYDLGDLYVEKGDFKQALGFFSEVYGVNSNYRDVASRIRELRKRIG